MHFDLPAHVDDRVGVGRLQDFAILLDDHLVPVDQLLRRAVLLLVVAEQDLDELDRFVVDRRRRS